MNALTTETLNQVWDACATLICRTSTPAQSLTIVRLRDAISQGDAATAQALAASLANGYEAMVIRRAIARL